MRKLVLMLTIAAGLSACGDVPVGPVDHSCASNPKLSQGSGCDERLPWQRRIGSVEDNDTRGSPRDPPRIVGSSPGAVLDDRPSNLAEAVPFAREAANARIGSRA